MLDGDWIVATVDGNYGGYFTQAKIMSKGKPGPLRNWSCTCPSDNSPCKHVSALVETWKVNARTFDDLAPRWKTLSLKPKGELIRLIREIGESHPGALRFALGLSDRVGEVSEQAEGDW
ncbi:MAG TPA: SWIM zinc finger family protein [Planctomycetota bacterium]|nr:SWIM zinc finger family protein [Planctomycetota bacterium]